MKSSTSSHVRLGKIPPYFSFDLSYSVKNVALEKKCRDFSRVNLRAPPWKLMLIWGRQLKLDLATIKDISAKLPLRHALGTHPPVPFLFPLAHLLKLFRSGQWTAE